jgi:hypothetical protein
VEDGASLIECVAGILFVLRSGIPWQMLPHELGCGSGMTFPEAGGQWQISVAGGTQPRWRRDGRELFYVAPDTRLMAVPIRLPSDRHSPEAGTPAALFPTRIGAGANFAAAGFQARAQYAVAADGRFLMNIAADESVTSPITIVQNWTAGLKK